jgi:hypothetical protein
MLLFFGLPFLYLDCSLLPRANTFPFICIVCISIQSIHIVVSFLLEQLIDAGQSLIEITLVACSQIMIESENGLLSYFLFDLDNTASTICEYFF